MLTDLIFSIVCFFSTRREDCGVSPETPDSDPWSGTEHWWVSVQASAVLNSLLINVHLWCFHKIVYLHDSTDSHHLNFQYQRPSEGLRAWGMMSSQQSLFDWFVSGVPSPKPKEAQRSILRPPVLQPPPARTPPQNSEYMMSISSSRPAEGELQHVTCMLFHQTRATAVQTEWKTSQMEEQNVNVTQRCLLLAHRKMMWHW